MNQHIVIGNLTRDPEIGSTESGIGWCRFTVAVNKKKSGEASDTEFVQVTTWRDLADSCGKYLAKGRKVCCVGESRAHAWQSQDGTIRAQIQMTARDVEFLGGAGGGAPKPTDADAPGGARSDPAPEDTPY